MKINALILLIIRIMKKAASLHHFRFGLESVAQQ